MKKNHVCRYLSERLFLLFRQMMQCSNKKNIRKFIISANQKFFYKFYLKILTTFFYKFLSNFRLVSSFQHFKLTYKHTDSHQILGIAH